MIFLSATKSKPTIAKSAEVKVSTEATSYDWGQININDGYVEKVFEILNDGTEALKLYNATTSCACTKAQLIYQETESPLFSMHSKSDFVLSVPPGEKAQLRVTFDPAAHGPSGLGPVSRKVIVQTNDQNQPELNFILTAEVVE